MSQVTRCPSCGTSFKVVPDQLRMSQGWVRCGQCNEIFDAMQDLRDPGVARADSAAHTVMQATVPASGSAAVLAPDEVPAEEREAAHAPAPTLVDVAPQWLQNAPPEIPVTDPAASLDVGFAEYQQARTQAEDHAAAAPWPTPVDEPIVPPADVPEAPVVDDVLPTPLGPERLFVAITPDAAAKPEGATSVDAMPLPQRPAAPSQSIAQAAPVWAPSRAAPVASPVHAEVSFLREAAEAAPLRSTAAPRRTLWRLAALVLSLALLVQLAVHSRDRVAAAAPALRPLLQTLCAPFQCSVQPLRRIDAVVIDGSAFIALGELGYRLSLTLRNRAPHAVALPALVLSLTDIQEQAVVRRVLLPNELGTPPSELLAHGEWSTSVDLQMADNAGRARVVGYRLDAFYP